MPENPLLLDYEEPSLPPNDLIFDDGEPLASNRHRIAMNVLIESVLEAFRDRTDFFVGGNLFVYYSRQQAMNRDFRGPDFFVTLNVDSQRERKAWVVWEENGRYPDVVVELMSPTTARVDQTVKKELYQDIFHTLDYYIYDPFDPTSFQGWHLNARRQYEPLVPNDRGWLWCETLELWLGLWQGRIQREPAVETCAWLRFYDPQGDLVLLPQESALQAQMAAAAAAARAQALAEQLRALGVDPDAIA